MSEIDCVWRYRDLEVGYCPSIDGDGRNQAPDFIAYIRRRFGERARFKSAFEWCAGPGFIGFSLLAEGIVDELCLADINPLAIQFVERTIRANDLGDRVVAYVSDNMVDVPRRHKFDLVVGNPPTFCAINPAHPDYPPLAGDLRANDFDWAAHAGFYATIGDFLTPDAQVLVQEVEPREAIVRMPDWNPIAWEIRPTAPLEQFKTMIDRGGLRFHDAELFHVGPDDGVSHYMMHSSKAADGSVPKAEAT